MDASSPPQRRPIFAIFEGGGAKGVAHVGALDAIDRNGLDIIGVAGTSAGALAAVLVAIGLEADDIINPDDPTDSILRRFGETPRSLLGEAAWERFRRVRDIKREVFGGGPMECCLEMLDAAPTLAAMLWGVWRRRGHFATDRIVRFVNGVVRARLSTINSEGRLGRDVPNEATFGDLANGWPTVVPLKIVVTDVDRGKLMVLDARTPEVKVAEAVAASIAIPFVFEPARIPSFREGEFADGGLVSNFPIWIFAEEKLAHERARPAEPPVPIIGFSLAPPNFRPEGVASRRSIFGYAKDLAETALAGSQTTSQRFLDDVNIVPVDCDLGLLDFDAGIEALKAARTAGFRCADRDLRFSLDVKPERIRHELRAVRQLALDAINRHGAKDVRHLRTNLIRRHGDMSLRVVEGINMDGDADDRLLLDLRGRGAAQAWREKGLRIFRLGRWSEDPAPDFMTKYERALVRPTVRSAICVPIFEGRLAWDQDEADRPLPAGILALDSDEDLAIEFNTPDLVNMLVDKSVLLFAAISLEAVRG